MNARTQGFPADHCPQHHTGPASLPSSLLHRGHSNAVKENMIHQPRPPSSAPWSSSDTPDQCWHLQHWRGISMGSRLALYTTSCYALCSNTFQSQPAFTFVSKLRQSSSYVGSHQTGLSCLFASMSLWPHKPVAGLPLLPLTTFVGTNHRSLSTPKKIRLFGEVEIITLPLVSPFNTSTSKNCLVLNPLSLAGLNIPTLDRRHCNEIINAIHFTYQ